jgi:hypothetical protein
MPELDASNPKHAELERRKHNLHRVYNPTNKDFKIVFNAAVAPETWIIRSHQEEVVPEYVCKKYLKNMSDNIIFTQSKERIDTENEKREKSGMHKMNLYEEQPMFESRTLKISEDQYVKMMAQLYRGLEKEYGLDTSPDVSPIMQGSSKPVFESAMKKIFDGNLPSEEEINEPKASPEPLKQTEEDEVVIDTGKNEKSTEASDLKSKIDAERAKVSKPKGDK